MIRIAAIIVPALIQAISAEIEVAVVLGVDLVSHSTDKARALRIRICQTS